MIKQKIKKNIFRTLRASSNQISMREVNFFQNIIAAEGKHLNSFHREYFLTAGKMSY